MKKIFKEAHRMTREMVNEYGVDYKAQFSLCLSYLLEKEKEEEGMKVKMKELKGTKKQVKFANDIKEAVMEIIEKLPEKIEKYSKYDAMREEYMKLYNNDIKKLFEGYKRAGDFIGDWKAVIYAKRKSDRVLLIHDILEEKGLGITARIMFKFQQEYLDQEFEEYMNSL